MLETGFASKDMIGSASAWRSYGLTQGSMLPHPVSAAAPASRASHFTAVVTCPVVTIDTSFFDERANLVQVFAFVARLVAAVHGADVALAIDEDRARHRVHVVELAHLALT